MSLKTIFIINAIVAGFFALITLLIPATMLSWYSVEYGDATIMMTRFFGVALLAIALTTFYLKNSKYDPVVKSVVLAILISDVVGVLVAIWGQISNVINSLGWTTVIIYAFLSVAYYSIYSKK